MKIKGFTMIELLGVFTVAGIILLIAIPQITSLLKTSNEQEYEAFLNNIYIATEAYVEDQNIKVEQNSTTEIALIQLVSSGFLKSTLVNPNNNKKVSESPNADKKVIISINEDNILEYELEN